MPSYTRTDIIGYLGQTAESNEIAGTTLTKMSVATSRKVKGEKVTDWYNISVWGEIPDWKFDSLHKGALVHITGRMVSRKYEKDGVMVTAWDLEARAFNVTPLQPAENTHPQHKAPATPATAPNRQPQKPESYNDDLPF
jgi:single-stranded DNA-binding protein